MKNTVYILAAIAILGIIAVYTIPDRQKETLTTSAQANTSQTTTPTPQPAETTVISQNTSDESVAAVDVLKDGTYTGAIDNNQFGNTEVSITVSDGAIINIELLQLPDSDSRSRQISQYATDILIDNTLSKQSADLDIVSGATYTSVSYINSLQSAIDQAKL